MSSDLLVKKHSFKKTVTSDWKYSAKLGEDKATASGSYKDDFQGWASRCPSFKTEHPDLPGMVLIEIDANREEGDTIKVDLKYESSAASAQYPGRPKDPTKQKRYAIEISSGEEHILSADIYGDNLDRAELEALMAIANGPGSKEELEDLKAQITSELGLNALAKISKGNISRRNSGLIWVEKSVTDDLADVEFAKIDTIQTPPGLPNPVEGKWLYRGTPAVETAEGGFYELEKRWEFTSLAGGWDTDLYAAP